MFEFDEYVAIAFDEDGGLIKAIRVDTTCDYSVTYKDFFELVLSSDSKQANVKLYPIGDRKVVNAE